MALSRERAVREMLSKIYQAYMMLLSSSKHEPTAGNSQKEFQSIQESNGRYAET